MYSVEISFTGIEIHKIRYKFPFSYTEDINSLSDIVSVALSDCVNNLIIVENEFGFSKSLSELKSLIINNMESVVKTLAISLEDNKTLMIVTFKSGEEIVKIKLSKIKLDVCNKIVTIKDIGYSNIDDCLFLNYKCK